MNWSDVAVIVVAAGRGVRAGGDGPKQYRPLAGLPVITRTINAFAAAIPGATIVSVIHADDVDLYESALASAPALRNGARILQPAFGGATRQESVRAGLAALDATLTKIVLIHDAARPLVSARLIRAAVDTAREHGAAIPALAPVDALKSVDEQGRILRDIDRNGVRAVQTPQAFSLILSAMRTNALLRKALVKRRTTLLSPYGRAIACIHSTERRQI